VILYYGWGVAALDPPMPVVRYQRRPGEALAPRHQKARTDLASAIASSDAAKWVLP